MCIYLQFQEKGKEGEIHSKSEKELDADPSELLLWGRWYTKSTYSHPF